MEIEQHHCRNAGHDVANTGRMLGRLGGVINVVNAGGTPEMAQSAPRALAGRGRLVSNRFLAGRRNGWHAVDDGTARATVTDGPVSVSGDFRFAASGQLRGMSAMRCRNVNGRGVLTPFEGYQGGFERREGVMVPSR